MEEKALKAKELAEKEAEENASRPTSKAKGRKPKKKVVKKGKKGKKGDDEEDKEDDYYPIVNLDYASYRTNSLPTLTAFHDFYKLLN
jgi:hypothetical protein